MRTNKGLITLLGRLARLQGTANMLCRDRDLWTRFIDRSQLPIIRHRGSFLLGILLDLFCAQALVSLDRRSSVNRGTHAM